jgi:hypothetical protein
MGTPIDVDSVTAVLLADGWHAVNDDSFIATDYEFEYNGRTLPGWPEGFSFEDTDGRLLTGPLSAIVAVNTGRIPRGDIKDGDES